MKPLQIISVIIISIVLLTQIARHGYQLVFGTERSVIEQFAPNYETHQKARRAKSMSILLDEYKIASSSVAELERGKDHAEKHKLRAGNESLYNDYDALRTEITQRESRAREIRCLLIFSAIGVVFITIGTLVYKRGVIWPGFGLIAAGFCELEYWASPSFFGGGAHAEYTVLLWTKLILSMISLALLYTLWGLRESRKAS
jgi:hypothetical protein